MKKLQIDLTRGNITKVLLIFALPLLISNLFQQLYNTADTMIVGNFLGDHSLAAIGSTAAVFELIIGFANGVGNGFGIIIARYYGSHDEEQLKKAVATSIVLSILISISLMVLSFVILEPLLILLKTPSNLIDEALSYILVITAGVGITMAFNLSAGLLRAIGDSFTALIVLVIASLLNIVLDIYFISVLKMGIQGAAVATLIAQFIAALCCFAFIYYKAKILIPKRQHFVYERLLTNDLFSQGCSMGFMLSIVSIGTVILQSAINVLGESIIAAHTSARKLFSLLSLPGGTLATSISTFVSQNYGAKQYQRIKEGVKIANWISVIYGIAISIVIFFTADSLIQVLSGSNDPILIENGAMYLKTNTPFFAVLGILLILRSSLQGFGKKLVPLVSSIIELIGKLIFTWMLIPIFGYLGVCFCEPIIWICMTVQLWFTFYRLPEFNACD